MKITALALAAAAAASLAWAAAPAGAAIPASLSDDANCDERTTGNLDYWFCDDGVPSAGGTIPNAAGTSAITVPAKYGPPGGGADSFTGLPGKATDAATVPGSDPLGNVALDVDVSLPRSAPPAGGYPLIVMMHGCCSGNKGSWEATSFDAAGETWHYSNAWFASRGYAVVTYTSRGFVDGQNRGSTGETQLDSRSFEINDFQHLACQVLGNASDWNNLEGSGNTVSIDPEKALVTGGSYGGGFSWLAMTDPRWQCTADTGAGATDMELAAAAPKYGWTDLLYSLVPTGTHLQEPGSLAATNGCDSGSKQLDGSNCPGATTPVGVPKTSIVSALFGSGTTGVPPGNHTTFPSSIDEAFACLQGPYPPELNPACSQTIGQTLPGFLRERSAYYQNQYFANLAGDPGTWRVPVFNAATFTDPLFTPVENRRMLNRLRSVDPDYPIQVYHGDYLHFVQSKAKEWGDLCGGDRHVCLAPDYPNGGAGPSDFNSNPSSLQRTGVTTRLNRFIDHYAAPDANPGEPQPSFDVTASLQVCPQNASGLGVDPSEPGPLFTAATFEQLAPNVLEANMPGVQTTLSKTAPNIHAAQSDPVANLAANGGRCPVAGEPGGVGVGTYDSDPLPSLQTMIGATRVEIGYSASGDAVQSGLELNARLYDVFPDGEAVMVDRGVRRVTSSSGTLSYELHANGWRFQPGHRVRIEIAQDDDPFLKASSVPSSATLTRALLKIPVIEGGQIGGGPVLLGGRCANLRIGTDGPDSLVGTSKGDDIEGRGGKDGIRGLKGKDCLDGEDDADRVAGGRGSDTVEGGKGRDKLRGGRGADRLKARGGGRDVVRCGRGRDTVKADRRDRVRGC